MMTKIYCKKGLGLQLKRDYKSILFTFGKVDNQGTFKKFFVSSQDELHSIEVVGNAILNSNPDNLRECILKLFSDLQIPVQKVSGNFIIESADWKRIADKLLK